MDTRTRYNGDDSYFETGDNWQETNDLLICLMQITTAIEVSWNDSDCGIETILLQEDNENNTTTQTVSYVWLHSFVIYSKWLRLGEFSNSVFAPCDPSEGVWF